MTRVVPVGVSLVGSGNARVNGRFFKVGVIARKIRNVFPFRRQTGDGAIGLVRTIARGHNHRTRWASGVRPVADRGQLPELILARKSQVPVAIEDTVVGASAKLKGMAAYHPRQVVLQCPTILRKSNYLAAFKGAKLIAQAPLALVVNEDIGSRLLCWVAFNRRIEETVVREGQLVRNAGAEGVCFTER